MCEITSLYIKKNTHTAKNIHYGASVLVRRAQHYSPIVQTSANTAGSSALPLVSSLSCVAVIHHCMGSVNICAKKKSWLCMEIK